MSANSNETQKPIPQRIDGILLLDKPQGISSNAALQRVKRLFGAKKAGHTGTLDPMASGMLPICFGEGTKFSQFLLDKNKTYEATGLLGSMTTTGDAWGEVISSSNKVNCSLDELQHAFSQFIGLINQVPPMYSALKHEGKPLYKYAREGQNIPRSARQVEIFEIQLLEFDGQRFKIRTKVSKGTYIRTLIEDIGIALGSQAHMTQLHRLSTAGFEHDPMISLEKLTDMTQAERLCTLFPIERAVSSLPKVTVTEAHQQALYLGQTVQINVPSTASLLVALHNVNGDFFGIGEYEPAGLSSSAKSILKTKRLRSIES
jgi:tRNA pseudouridine55 synthase